MSTNEAVRKKKWMPAMYVTYFGVIEAIANEHGYALCVHGSCTRDFDLVAIPFDIVVKPKNELIEAIKAAVGNSKSDPRFDRVGLEPHGRVCYTIECGAGGYFDISFTPTMNDLVEIQKKLKRDRKEMKRLLPD